MCRYYLRILVMGIVAMASVARSVLPTEAISGNTTNNVRQINYYPFVGFFVWYPPQGHPYDTCTAVLIRPTVALTARHCLYKDTGAKKPASELHVTFGGINRDENSSPNGGVTVGVTGYDTKDDADIAVLYLAAPVFITPLALPNKEQAASFHNKKELALMVLGWSGLTLREAGQKIIDSHASIAPVLHRFVDWWNLHLQGSYNYEMKADPAEPHSGGVEHGDSGGPLVAYEGSAQYLAGITSLTPDGCLRVRCASYYVNVTASSVRAFIDKHAPPDVDPVPGGKPIGSCQSNAPPCEPPDAAFPTYRYDPLYCTVTRPSFGPTSEAYQVTNVGLAPGMEGQAYLIHAPAGAGARVAAAIKSAPKACTDVGYTNTTSLHWQQIASDEYGDASALYTQTPGDAKGIYDRADWDTAIMVSGDWVYRMDFYPRRLTHPTEINVFSLYLTQDMQFAVLQAMRYGAAQADLQLGTHFLRHGE